MLVAAGWSCAPVVHEPAGTPARDEIEVSVVPRTPYLETYSCLVLCHNALEVNPVRRALTEFHTTRAIRHGTAIGWCDFCHELFDLDQLRLIDSSSVSFDESDRLCGQCHGEKHEDWEAGIHGLQTGSWQGPHARRTCTFCHDPHVPGVPRVTALPAPLGVEHRRGAP